MSRVHALADEQEGAVDVMHHCRTTIMRIVSNSEDITEDEREVCLSHVETKVSENIGLFVLG